MVILLRRKVRLEMFSQVSLFRRCCHQIVNVAKYSSSSNNLNKPAIVLYKYLMRQCDKLPKSAKQHYKFQIKQSFKQYKNETDPERIEQIISSAHRDIDWIMKKYLKSN